MVLQFVLHERMLFRYLTIAEVISHSLLVQTRQTGTVKFVGIVIELIEIIGRHYDNSSARVSTLQKEMRLLNYFKVIKIIENCATRWLTHFLSLKSIIASYLPILNDCQNRKLKDAATSGSIYTLLVKKENISILLALNDVLPIMANFSVTLQDPKIDLSDLKLLLTNVTTLLEAMCTTLKEVLDGKIQNVSSTIMPNYHNIDLFISEIESCGRHSVQNKNLRTGRTSRWIVKQIYDYVRANISNVAGPFPGHRSIRCIGGLIHSSLGP